MSTESDREFSECLCRRLMSSPRQNQLRQKQLKGMQGCLSSCFPTTTHCGTKAPHLRDHVWQQKDGAVWLAPMAVDHGARKATVLKISLTVLLLRQPPNVLQRFQSLLKQHCQLKPKCSNMGACEEHVTFKPWD